MFLKIHQSYKKTNRIKIMMNIIMHKIIEIIYKRESIKMRSAGTP